jgi:hypothetical protein
VIFSRRVAVLVHDVVDYPVQIVVALYCERAMPPIAWRRYTSATEITAAARLPGRSHLARITVELGVSRDYRGGSIRSAERHWPLRLKCAPMPTGLLRLAFSAT